MTANQYRQHLQQLDFTQAAAAEFLGISLRASQGYAIGEYPIPQAVAKLLRLMVRLKLNPQDVK
jgi:hypothetical protein